MLIIENVIVVNPDQMLAGQTVVLEHGAIATVGFAENGAGAKADVCRVDGQGMFLVPGFIDLHIHGTHAYMVDDGPDALAGLRKVLPQYGVTGFLPTLVPRVHAEHVALLRALARSLGCAPPDGAARVLGFHLEGPYLALTGALPPELDSRPNPDQARQLIDAGSGHKVVFSISPEVEGILEVIPLMRSSGAPVFITHTAANVEQTRAAIDAGACHATHFYDVFPAPAEDDPGVRACGAVEAILADERVSVDFILDNVHVNPVAIKLALACKGRDRVCLITDANVGAGLGAGSYRFGDMEVVFAEPGAPARLGENSRGPGGLAGSGLTMDQAVRNAVNLLGMELTQAVRMASANPAAVLGLAACKGRIESGFDADLVLLDRDLRVRKTWIGGECCYAGRGDTDE